MSGGKPMLSPEQAGLLRPALQHAIYADVDSHLRRLRPPLDLAAVFHGPASARVAHRGAGSADTVAESSAGSAVNVERLTGDTPPLTASQGSGLIWISAGPSGCNQEDESACRLYVIQWNFNTGTGRAYLELDETASGVSVVQAAVNDGQRYLSVVEQVYDGSGAHTESRLVVVDRVTNAKHTPVSESGGQLWPQFPNFYSYNSVLFHRGGKVGGVTMPTLYSIARNPDYSTVTEKARLGPASATLTVRSFQDANTHQAPNYGGAVPGERMIVSFGKEDTGALPHPQVHTRDGTTLQPFLRDSEEQTCQHPAWNVTGDRILCTMQEPKDKSVAPPRRALVGYFWNGTNWEAEASALFAAISPSSVSGLDVADCELVTYKYGEFCLSDDYVVFTIFCSSGDSVTASRVMLLQLSTELKWDLTTLVEELEGVGEGAWQGQYSTCSGAKLDAQ